MGEVGAATTPDINSMHWNPAKYIFIDGDYGVTISYTPWMRKLIHDINLAYVSGYYKFDKQQAIAASLRYFTLGEIQFTGMTPDENLVLFLLLSLLLMLLIIDYLVIIFLLLLLLDIFILISRGCYCGDRTC